MEWLTGSKLISLLGRSLLSSLGTIVGCEESAWLSPSLLILLVLPLNLSRKEGVGLLGSSINIFIVTLSIKQTKTHLIILSQTQPLLYFHQQESPSFHISMYDVRCKCIWDSQVAPELTFIVNTSETMFVVAHLIYWPWNLKINKSDFSKDHSIKAKIQLSMEYLMADLEISFSRN